MANRSVRAIIDDALSSNLHWERLCFGLVILLVLAGLATLVTGIITDKNVVALSGAGVTGLFWPAMRYADSFRRDNIRLRMFECALTTATPEELVVYLREAIGVHK